MVENFKPNQVISGSYGKVWVNGELLGQCKSFEAKLSINYESVQVAEELGEYQKMIGYTGAGTMILHKVDSTIFKMLKDGISTGILPDIKIVGRLADPASLGVERVELLDVTIDEVMLLKYKLKEIQEEEVPFKFAKFNPLEVI